MRRLQSACDGYRCNCSNGVSDRFALIANPGSERAAGFLAACHSQGFPEPILIPWEEALSPSFDPGIPFTGARALRFETPAGHLQVERLILARGAMDAEKESGERSPGDRYLPAEECLVLPDDEGEFRYQRQWYLGWCRVLDEVEAWCRDWGLRLMNAPREVAVLFDKLATRKVLEREQVPVPPGAGHCTGFDDLLAKMDAQGWDRVFLKPCHGSSAAGVMAIARAPGGRWLAVTSAKVESIGGKIRVWNSKRPLRLTSLDEVCATVDMICRQGALIERWFPKATLGGRAFDLRIVVIAGRAAHVAVRTSDTPITNLHLRNRRGDLQEVIDKIGPDAWQAALTTAERAAACFPGCHHCGVDLMIGARNYRSAVAEVNAFGDHLHRELWQGMNPWEAELALWHPADAKSLDPDPR